MNVILAVVREVIVLKGRMIRREHQIMIEQYAQLHSQHPSHLRERSRRIIAKRKSDREDDTGDMKRKARNNQ